MKKIVFLATLVFAANVFAQGNPAVGIPTDFAPAWGIERVADACNKVFPEGATTEVVKLSKKQKQVFVYANGDVLASAVITRVGLFSQLVQCVKVK